MPWQDTLRAKQLWHPLSPFYRRIRVLKLKRRLLLGSPQRMHVLAQRKLQPRSSYPCSLERCKVETGFHRKIMETPVESGEAGRQARTGRKLTTGQSTMSEPHIGPCAGIRHCFPTSFFFSPACVFCIFPHLPTAHFSVSPSRSIFNRWIFITDSAMR